MNTYIYSAVVLSICAILISATNETDGYIMDPYITCYENNRFSYRGYHDPNYEGTEPYESELGGEGDVCDHTSSTQSEVRDSCYFQVVLGQETWGYKCMHHNDCPLKDPVTGEGIMGCVNVTNKRITCCCQEDLCNGPAYVGYALLGYPENFVPVPEEPISNKPGVAPNNPNNTVVIGEDDEQEEEDEDEDYDGYDENEETSTTTTEEPVVTDQETEPPETETSQTEVTETEQAQTEAPETEPPQTEAPMTEAPQTEAPQTTHQTIIIETEVLTDEPVYEITDEMCLIHEVVSQACSCGVDCEAYEREYFVSIVQKCGETVLRTGEFGADTCDPSNVPFEVGQSVPCRALPCDIGEVDLIVQSNAVRDSIVMNLVIMTIISYLVMS